jgi:hypothetical protein
MNKFNRELFQALENLKRQLEVKPVNLGGYEGSGGGTGAPPAGFIGQLSQLKVTYDLSEIGASGTSSDSSLLDNLNHIRYRIDIVESGGNTNIEDLSSQVNGVASGFSVSGVISPGTLGVFYNGLRQLPSSHVLDIDYEGFTMDFIPTSGMYLTVEYMGIN